VMISLRERPTRRARRSISLSTSSGNDTAVFVRFRWATVPSLVLGPSASEDLRQWCAR
jgi:hypothetical protein